MKRTLVRLGLTALVISTLVGCGGGGGGGSTSSTPSPVVTTPPDSSATAPSAIAAWKVLAPQITVESVTIASPPVVKFTVVDASGKGITGLGNVSRNTTSSTSTTHTLPGLTNLAFTLAKLVVTPGAPSKWVSYNVIRPLNVAEKTAIPSTSSCTADKTWCGTFPATDTQGTLVDHGNGSYTYTFLRDPKQVAGIVASLIDSADGLSKKADLGDLTFDPSATHRLGIQVGGAAPGTGSNTPDGVASTISAVNMTFPGNTVYEFRPDGAAVTNTRSVVSIDSCAGCHDGKGLAHSDSRKDPNYCVTCHTDQIRYSFSQEASSTNGGMTLTGTTRQTTAVVDGRAVGNYPNLIHKVHMGDELVKQGYNFNAHGGAMQFNNNGLPQNPANCSKCHNGSAPTSPLQAVQTKDGDNWKTVPNRLACGACHDGINFATGQGTTLAGATTGHGGGVAGAQSGDSMCSTCHPAAAIALYHRANLATPNNPVVKAGVATISYDLKSVTVNPGKQPVVTFRIMKDGAPVTTLAVPSKMSRSQSSSTQGQVVVDPNFEAISGFIGGPTLYVMYAVPQDNAATPADFNGQVSASLANLLLASGSPKAGTITGPDADGYFTAVLVGDTIGQAVDAGCVVVTAPTAATCVSKAKAPSPIAVPAAAKMLTAAIIGTFRQKDASFVAADYTVNPRKDASGGVLIKPLLKSVVAAGNSARRTIVSAARCNGCHEQLGTKPEFHGGARNDPTACAFCHTTNANADGWSYNASTFIHGIHGASKRTTKYTWQSALSFWTLGYPGVLRDCTQCHEANTVNFGANASTLLPNLLWTTVATGTTSAAGASTSPDIAQTAGKAYGSGFSVSSAGVSTLAAGTTLVSSPISAVCYSCHTDNAVKVHISQNGGVLYEARSTALVKSESCLFCHGQGRVYDVEAVHHK